MFGVRTRLIVDTQPLIDVEQFAKDFTRITGDLAEETGVEIQPEFLGEMRTYPPVPPGSTYERTFELRDKMNVRVVRDGNQTQIIAESRAPHTKWVVGTFDKRRGAGYQTAKHKQTGWILIARTAGFWQEAYAERYHQKFDAIIPSYFGTFSTRRANR